jgi:hypothetical protein
MKKSKSSKWKSGTYWISQYSKQQKGKDKNTRGASGPAGINLPIR